MVTPVRPGRTLKMMSVGPEYTKGDVGHTERDVIAVGHTKCGVSATGVH